MTAGGLLLAGGLDLFARAGDLVVAPEDGRVLAILPFNAGTWAVYLRSSLREVQKLSWREFGVAPGQQVKLGQPLARIGRRTRGSTMLHFEAYGVGAETDESIVESIRAGALPWLRDGPAPAWLRDPSGYLLETARRAWHRETIAP